MSALMLASTCNEFSVLWYQPSKVVPRMRYGTAIGTILSVTEIVRDSLRSFEVSRGVSLPRALSALENGKPSVAVILMNLSVGTRRDCPEVSHRRSCELLFCTPAYLRIFCLGSLFRPQIFGPRNPRIVERWRFYWPLIGSDGRRRSIQKC